MAIKATPTPGSNLISPKDHALIMIDFQSQMSFATHSIDAVTLRNNAALVAHAAAGFKVPTILTTVATNPAWAVCLTSRSNSECSPRAMITTSPIARPATPNPPPAGKSRLTDGWH